MLLAQAVHDLSVDSVLIRGRHGVRHVAGLVLTGVRATATASTSAAEDASRSEQVGGRALWTHRREERDEEEVRPAPRQHDGAEEERPKGKEEL